MSEKFTIEYVKDVAKKRGYKCLSNKYINIFLKLEFQCSMNHIFFMPFNDFKRGCICPKCYERRRRKTIDDIKIYTKKFGYTCLTVKKGYILSYSKLKFKCPMGHIYKTRWDIFQQGSRCPVCRYINMSGEKSPRWKGGISLEPYCDIWLDEEYKQSIKDRDGYKCLNPDCTNICSKLVLHHINYNKKDCNPENIITVCLSCNSRANKDREWHEAWYKAIIYRRYECLV
jgi:hypothetical protein